MDFNPFPTIVTKVSNFFSLELSCASLYTDYFSDLHTKSHVASPYNSNVELEIWNFFSNSI